MENIRWFEIENIDTVPSPSLLLYPHRIEENIRRMVAMAGDANKLRPHIKTHKMSEILYMQDDFDITRCKCSTIAEAELAAMTGVKDILLAIQPVGPNISRFFELKKAYPFSKISAIVDSGQIIKQISEEAIKYDLDTTLWLDINTGMNRTGVLPNDDAIELYKLIDSSPYLNTGGLHVYDGQIHDYLLADRLKTCNDDFVNVSLLKQNLEELNFPVPGIIAGGSPTFPIHAQRSEVNELSPGTTVLWDYKYSQLFPDLNFLFAALVLTRVISKPANDLLCLDLGHKSIASDIPHPRVKLIGLEDYTIRNHSEEHLVIECHEAKRYEIGSYFYGIPYHICPTVARYERAVVIHDRKAINEWRIEARDRKINY